MGNDGWFATLFNGCSSKIRIEGQIYVPKEVMTRFLSQPLIQGVQKPDSQH